MFRKRQVEQAMIMAQEREMEQYLNLMLDNHAMNVDEVREMFLQQYPHEYQFLEDYIEDYFR